MSVRISANNQSLTRTANIPSPGTTGYTIMFWAYIVSNTGALQDMFWLHTTSVSNYHFHGALSGLSHYFEDDSGNSITGSSLSTGTWYHLALTVTPAGSTKIIYLNGTADGNTAGVDTFTPNTLRLGNNPGASRHYDGRFAAYKEWSVVLTPTEINAEINSYAAVKTANLVAECHLQLASNLTDSSGNGNDFTGAGSLTTEADPPALSPSTGPTLGTSRLLFGVGT